MTVLFSSGCFPEHILSPLPLHSASQPQSLHTGGNWILVCSSVINYTLGEFFLGLQLFNPVSNSPHNNNKMESGKRNGFGGVKDMTQLIRTLATKLEDLGLNLHSRRELAPGTLSVDKVGLELTEIYLILPSECWDWRCAPSPLDVHHGSHGYGCLCTHIHTIIN